MNDRETEDASAIDAVLQMCVDTTCTGTFLEIRDLPHSSHETAWRSSLQKGVHTWVDRFRSHGKKHRAYPLYKIIYNRRGSTTVPFIPSNNWIYLEEPRDSGLLQPIHSRSKRKKDALASYVLDWRGLSVLFLNVDTYSKKLYKSRLWSLARAGCIVSTQDIDTHYLYGRYVPWRKGVISGKLRYHIYIPYINNLPFMHMVGYQLGLHHVRFRKHLKSGAGSKAVLMFEDIQGGRYVLKITHNKEAYLNEKNALLKTRDWVHSPSLLYFNDDRMYLLTPWYGKDLRKKSKMKKRRLKPHVQEISRRLNQIYGLYHNDIRWKNMVQFKSQLILLDWGMADTLNQEKDDQHILL